MYPSTSGQVSKVVYPHVLSTTWWQEVLQDGIGAP